MFFFRGLRRRSSLPTNSATGVQFQWLEGEFDHLLANFLLVLGELHQVNRQGWKDRGATIPEWVLDHQSFVAHAVLNFGEYLKPKSLKVTHAFWLALVHDIGELRGDRTPHYGHNPQNARDRRRYFSRLPTLSEDVRQELQRIKEAEEESSMALLTSFMTLSMSRRYLNAWNQYREQETMEAQFVHQIHALVDCMRATLYKSLFPKEEFSTFFDTARIQITDQVLLRLLSRVEAVFKNLETGKPFRFDRP